MLNSSFTKEADNEDALFRQQTLVNRRGYILILVDESIDHTVQFSLKIFTAPV